MTAPPVAEKADVFLPLSPVPASLRHKYIFCPLKILIYCYLKRSSRGSFWQV